MGRLRVTFLGTGSPQHLDRANASIAFQFGADGAAGEQTLLADVAGGMEILRQLRAARITLESIRHIFVSHQHFDHAAGLPILLLALSRSGTTPIHVYVPADALSPLQSVLSIQAPGVTTRLEGRLRWHALAPGDAVELGAGVTLTATRAVHPVPALGCVVRAGGVAVGYSGDTAPFEGIGAAYAAVDVLIHEASALEGPGADAMHHIGHSTGADAGRAAAEAAARELIVTHFGPQPPDRPQLAAAEARAHFAGRVRVAEDFMVVDLP
ncbi:MAG TPA: MBL fold metallo-hydrolase [Chloroflexota bacterium]|nr:MBL fold metallo-hydrolase [Chloroflexota bacterium]